MSKKSWAGGLTFFRRRGYNCKPRNGLPYANSHKRERDNKCNRLKKVKKALKDII